MLVALDFETKPIGERPDFPPEPVGVAIEYEGRPSAYLAWGHRGENPDTRADAERVLEDLWAQALAGEIEIVMHNAKFDLAVAYERFGLPELPWSAVHDTQFLAYLVDPHARQIDLKKLATEWLDEPPDERDAMAEWLWEHRFELRDEGHDIKGQKGKATKASMWTWLVPHKIAGEYAMGDVRRTLGLFKAFMPLVRRYKMVKAYDRERRLLPILMENERDGMRVDVELLRKDVTYYGKVLEYVDEWLRKHLRAPGLSFDNDADVAEVFAKRGVVDEEDWTLTPSGQRSIAKDNLPPEKYRDQQVAQAFGYRNRLSTCLKMFMRPWLAQAEKRGGVISTNWNQLYGEGGGTRTGRPSTAKPNFLNISKDFEGRSDGYKHPDFLDVDPLPLVRRYILPDEGHVFLHRDFSGQEVRIFAHFEQGDLLEAYQRFPALDPHGWLKDIIRKLTGQERERTKVKNVTFLRLYGGGKGAVQAQLRVDVDEAAALLAAHDKALPGRKLLVDTISELARAGRPIRTWGGRLYFEEEPRKIDGRWRKFTYKLINYLVQGSAADMTKECLIRWHVHPDRDPRTRFLVTVYDEINITCPEDCWQDQMRLLQRCMEDVKLDCPMVTEGKVGDRWGDLEVCVSANDWIEQGCKKCGARHTRAGLQMGEPIVYCPSCGPQGPMEGAVYMKGDET